MALTRTPLGTSFAPVERVTKNLTGLIPHTLESMDTQVMRALRMINSRTTPIDKYLYLSNLKGNNVDLFYRVLIDHVAQMMPLVYTPTIGDVCLQYSSIYTRPEALYISIKQRKSIAQMLRNWPNPNPSICVVTDGSRILGLGDLGMNGVGISVSDRVHKCSKCVANNTRLASSLSTPLLLVFILIKPCQLFWTVGLRMRIIWQIRSTSDFVRGECPLRTNKYSWMSS